MTNIGNLYGPNFTFLGIPIPPPGMSGIELLQLGHIQAPADFSLPYFASKSGPNSFMKVEADSLTSGIY